MSDYTYSIKEICEGISGLSGIGQADSIIELAKGQIFGNYEIFESGYKGLLEKKILKHYYTREICVDDIELWKFRMNNKMNEIMPYYNQMYKSAKIDFQPMEDFKVTEILDESVNVIGSTTGTLDETVNVTGNNTETVNGTQSNSLSNFKNTDVTNERNEESNNESRHSNTPQNGLADVRNDKYITTADIDDVKGNITEHNEGTENNVSTANTTNKTEGEVNATNDTVRNNETSGSVRNDTTRSNSITRSGKSGGKSYSEMLTEFRKTFLNIDMMVIGELGEMFFNLY